MNLNQLYYLRAIARAKGLTRAAEALYVTQSNLSHAMAALEEELGIPLFYKNGRDILLTPYGQEFLEYADRAIQELEQGIQVAQSRRSPARGLVRVGTISALSSFYVPKCISQFGAVEENAQITFALEEKPTRKIARDFAQHSVDIGFGSHFDEPGFLFHPVVQEELVAIVPTGHHLAQQDGVTLEELEREELVTYNQYSPTRSLILEMFRRKGLKPRLSIEATTDQMLASFVSLGRGVGIMPRMFLLQLYQVKILPIEGAATHRELYMFRPEDRELLPAAQKFWDFVAALPVEVSGA